MSNLKLRVETTPTGSSPPCAGTASPSTASRSKLGNSHLGNTIAPIARNLRSLAAQGIAIALDDFGAGFISLTHLKSLPITRVKIDRSFIGNIVADPESRSIAEAKGASAAGARRHGLWD